MQVLPHQRVRLLVAGLAAVGLIGIAPLSAVAAPAPAAEVIFVDQRVMDTDIVTAWSPGGAYEVGQPFIPHSSGALVDLTVWMNNLDPRTIASAEVRSYPLGGEVAAAPITGGTASLSFPNTADPTVPDDRYAAIMRFPDRPALTAGERYIVVITASVAPGGARTSLTLGLVFGGVPDLNTMTNEGGTWEVYATGQLWYELRMSNPAPLVTITPDAPTLMPSAECDLPGSVILPTQTGSTYTTDTDGSTVTVTASADDGYDYPADATDSWVYDISAAPCPPLPTPDTPAQPPAGGGAGGQLADTGGDSVAAILAVALMAAAGGLVLLASRRRASRHKG